MVIIIFDVRQNRKGVTKRAVCDAVSSLFTEGTEWLDLWVAHSSINQLK